MARQQRFATILIIWPLAVLREVCRNLLPCTRSSLGVQADLRRRRCYPRRAVNPKGVPALYLALTIMTAIKEANQGLAQRIDPCVLCSYEVDCEDIADLTTEEGRGAFSVSLDEMACAWATALIDAVRPPSWSIYDRLRPGNVAGIVVPSFAPRAEREDRNLVLWDWVRIDPIKSRCSTRAAGCRRISYPGDSGRRDRAEREARA